MIDIQKPHFNADHAANRDFVLVKVDAFSCNYRDKAIILKAALRMSGQVKMNAAPVSFFGSDFVGTVVEKGDGVKEFTIGDRVIPDCAYPNPPAPEVAPGVVTNEASKGWLRLHKSKLIRIPSSMSNTDAAGFTIGAQTSHSMIRRTQVHPGQRALVISARSNTSLFLIKGLVSLGIDTWLFQLRIGQMFRRPLYLLHAS
ncbi:alcohol dehydrogenase catalytic domain-containing protein [Terrilactibacillus sp. S3-3]|nr:alcohol dehydrogenase catalytic domain-containing protein [Terrilactibacillus sp. S3-3]